MPKKPPTPPSPRPQPQAYTQSHQPVSSEDVASPSTLPRTQPIYLRWYVSCAPSSRCSPPPKPTSRRGARLENSCKGSASDGWASVASTAGTGRPPTRPRAPLATPPRSECSTRPRGTGSDSTGRPARSSHRRQGRNSNVFRRERRRTRRERARSTGSVGAGRWVWWIQQQHVPQP